MKIRKKVVKTLTYLKTGYNMKEIKNGEELIKKLSDGINKIADVVTTTLGPSGNTVIIADEYGEPYITKDGVSVSNYVTLEDPVENIAAKLLKQVAKKTVEEAGDGTTTSICLARAFINQGFELLNKGVDYSKLKRNLNQLEELVINELLINAKELNKDNIIDVATISANNDKKIGQIIQNAYEHSEIVKIEEGNNTEDDLITINGMQLDTGYLDKVFINVPSKQSIMYDNPKIILIKGKLNKLDNISYLLNQINDGPIIIVADHVSEQTREILRENYNRGAISIGLVKSPGFAEHRSNLMDDLAIYTGATLLSPHTKYTDVSVIGNLSSITVEKNKCLFTNNLNNINVEEHLSDLKKVYDSLEGEQDKYLLEQRIEKLNGKISVIKVGGNSELEMKERKDRIEDAVLAVQCALEEGIVQGGGCALYNIKTDNLFEKCLGAPLQKILHNGAEFNYLEDVSKQNIIDPVKVTRIALQNAISVAKTILGTDSIVLNERLWR